ncbi:MAG: hypothetical protein N2234_00610 [Planctomycetota bacterium]|nr:hypothetical protein [Planctomycetota bacterium]
MRKGILGILGVLLLVSTVGCGSAIIGAILALQPKAVKKRPAQQDTAPTVYILPISGTQSGDVTVTYILIDQGSDPTNISVQFSEDKGSTYKSATESSSGYSEGTTGLSTSPSGVPHIFIWDSKAVGNLDGVVNKDVRIRITPQDHDGAGTSVEISISLDNNDPPSVVVDTPVSPANGPITITYTLADTEGDICSITVEYSTDGGVTYEEATGGTGGDGTSGLSSSHTGESHTFVWDSFTDLGYAYYTNVKVRITPADTKSGGWGESEAFEVNNNEAPIAQVNTPTTEQSGNVFLTYLLYDSNSDFLDIEIEWWDPFVSQWKPATEVTGAPSEGTVNLSSSPNGTSHIFVWNSTLDLGTKYSNQIRVRIRPSDVLLVGSWAESGSFAVANNAAPITFVQNPTGVQTANVLITYYLADEESDNCSITVYYSEDGGSTWYPATEVAGGGSGDGTTNLQSSQTGIEHKFDWDAQTDLVGKYRTTVRIRIVPNDGYRNGTGGSTANFTVDATTPPSVVLTSPTGTLSGSIPLEYTLVDAESQQCSIVVKYTKNGGATWQNATKGSGGDPLTGLSSSPAGTPHTFIWDTISDGVGASGAETVRVRITVSDTKVGNTATSTPFNVNNTVATQTPWIVISTPSSPQTGTFNITYNLYDNQGQNCNVEVQFSTDGGGAWNPCTGSPVSNTPVGTGKTFAWNSVADIGNVYNQNVRIRMRPTDIPDGNVGNWAPTANFTVDNNAAPSVTVTTPVTPPPVSGNVTISYKIFDSNSDTCSVYVEYSDDGGATYKPATKGTGGDPITGLSSSPGGTPHTYVWDSFADIGATQQDDIRIRITPNDGYRNGSPSETGNFSVSNAAIDTTWTGNADTNWYNANNWDNGVPTSMNNVIIPASRPRYPTLVVPATTPTVTVASLSIANGASLTLKGDFTFAVTSDATIDGALTLDCSSLYTTFSVGNNLTVGASGIITASGKGYASGRGPEPGGSASGSGGGSGGGHGGYGGYGSEWAKVGGVYGSVVNPLTQGSGGGSGNSGNSAGGAGGGAMRILVGKTFTLNGSVTSDGANANNGGGGGAGGSILVDCDILTGTGYFRANGGNATGSPLGGGGAGGRIAIYYNNDSSYAGRASCNAAGGTGHYAVSYMYGSLVFINKNNSSTTTDDDLYIYHKTHLNETLYVFRNITITNAAEVAFDSYAADSTTCPQITLEATSNIVISSGCLLTASGLGYPGSEGPGQGGDDPQGSGTGGHGGGHGGYGGRGDNNAANPLGSPYGDFLKPMTSGSGGGHGDSYWGGGAGGGAVRLKANGTLTLNGIVRANGASPSNSDAGGGAGGSILIECYTLVGSGFCTANGAAGDDDGGGGAGGRVAIHYVDRSGYSGQASCTASGGAAGGGVNNPYGAGACGSCVFVNTKGTVTTSDDDLHIYTACRITQATLSCANITLYSGVTFYVDSHAAGDVQIVITVSGNVSIPAGCSIRASELGYLHSEGPGAGTDADAGAGGGGHGGAGGNGGGGAAGGVVNGNSSNPVNCGSGGGDRDATRWGGSGGGSLKLVVGGTLQVNGSITANGENAKWDRGGGGSGGSIWLVCNTLSGNGSIVANGGNGGSNGGGGGGGRIRIQRNSTSFTGTKTANGGTGGGGGAQNGSPGTVVEP